MNLFNRKSRPQFPDQQPARIDGVVPSANRGDLTGNAAPDFSVLSVPATAPVQQGVPFKARRRNDLSDLFRVPHEKDNDMYTKDLFRVPSDLTDVSTSDITGYPEDGQSIAERDAADNPEPPVLTDTFPGQVASRIFKRHVVTRLVRPTFPPQTGMGGIGR